MKTIKKSQINIKSIKANPALFITLVFLFALVLLYALKLISLPSEFQKQLLSIRQQSSSTEAVDIEYDLNNTDFSSLNRDIQDLEKEFGSY